MLMPGNDVRPATASATVDDVVVVVVVTAVPRAHIQKSPRPGAALPHRRRRLLYMYAANALHSSCTHAKRSAAAKAARRSFGRPVGTGGGEPF